MDVPPNKRMQLTKPEHIGASQLIRSVRRTGGRGEDVAAV